MMNRVDSVLALAANGDEKAFSKEITSTQKVSQQLLYV